MGRGPTIEEERAAKRNFLTRTRRRLQAAGVETLTGKNRITSVSADVYDKWGSDAAAFVKFAVVLGDTLRASNGEAALNPEITVSAPVEAGGKTEVYGLIEIDRGVERIIAIFGNEKARRGLNGTTLAALVQAVENAVRESCRPLPTERKEAHKIYLHAIDGKRIGEVYAYNEVRDGKPKLRIAPLFEGAAGPWCGDASYREFEVGQTVRWGDGRLIAERVELPPPPDDE